VSSDKSGWFARLSPAGWTALFATVLGLVMRFYHLGAQSLWMDEASSLRNGRAFGAGGLEGMAQVDQIAPLHSITLWLMTVIGGDSEISLRMPSALAGIGLIPMVYLLGKRMGLSPWVGAIAALLVAISPYAIWYSQEARMYACLIFVTAVFVYFSWPVLTRPLRLWELAVVTLAGMIGYGMHHYMILVVGAFGLLILVQGLLFRPRIWFWIATQAVAFLFFAGWLYLTREWLGNVAGTEKPLFLLWAPYTFYTYVAGFSLGPAPRDIQVGLGSVIQHVPVIAVIALSAVVLGLGGAFRALRTPNRAAGRWILIWLFAPIVIAILATQVTNIRYNVRYVVACFPALMILFSLAIHTAFETLRDARAAGRPWYVGLAGLWAATQVFAAVVLVVCSLWSLSNHYWNDHYAKEDVRDLTPAVMALAPGTRVLSDNNRVEKTLIYYGGRPLDPELQVDYTRLDRSPEPVLARLAAIPPADRRRVALIEYRPWEGDPTHLMRSRISQTYSVVETHAFPGAKLTVFELTDRQPATR
jgi:uncharacterized membrane protein